MFESSDEVLGYINKNEVQFVDVRFCDLPGIMQHFTFPASNFGESVFSDGLMFDGSSIRGFQQIHESDMLLLPDPSTAYMDPFRQHPTLIMNFFIHDPLTGEAYSRDPRNIAKKAEDYLRRLRDRGHVVLRAGGGVLHLRRRPLRPDAALRPTTTSTRSRVRGTPGVRSRAATRATSRATRAATSRCRRPTTSPTCGRRWSGCCWRSASTSRCSTTRSARPGRPRSTSGSARCSRPPTT